MTETSEPERVRRRLVNVPGGELEAFVSEFSDPRAPVVCTAHPALAYGHVPMTVRPAFVADAVRAFVGA